MNLGEITKLTSDVARSEVFGVWFLMGAKK